MINLTNEVMKDRYKKMFRNFRPIFNQVYCDAINAANEEVRKQVKDRVPKEWGVKKNELADFKLYKAAPDKLDAKSILKKKSRTHLRDLDPVQKSWGVGYMFKGLGRLERSAFITNLGARGRGVYKRVFHASGSPVMYQAVRGKYAGKMRQAVKTMTTTLTVPEMSISEKTQIPPMAYAKAQAEFDRVFRERAETALKLLGFK